MEADSESSIQEWKCEQQFPAHFSLRSPVMERQLKVDPPCQGRYYAEQVTFDGILITQSTFLIDEPTSLQSQVHGEAVSMLFFLKGDRVACHHADAEKIRFTHGCHNIYYASGKTCELELAPKDGILEFVEVNLSKAYYFRLFGSISAEQHSFAARIRKGQAGCMFDTHLQITPAMQWIINDIKQCKRNGCLKRLFLEARVLELLRLQVEQSQQQVKRKKRETQDNDLLIEARLILEQQMVDPPTISKLSKMVGLNEFLLKKGFKDMFGITIYGYVNQLKMQQARRMLVEEGKSVSETAYRVGYKNPQHFTTAFKRFFGILPSELKQ